MRITTRLLSIAALAVSTACGGGSGTPSATSPTPAPVPLPNIQPITVGGGPHDEFANGIYTSVTVCVPGTSDCQTIGNILVDTGSTGLRLLGSALHLSLPRQHVPSGAPLGECYQYVSTFVWGPIAEADLKLADETAESVPVQVFAASGFPKAPRQCSSGFSEQKTVSSVGGNGILGVGSFPRDCGAACAHAGASLPNLYYACPGSGCKLTAVPLDKQVPNPVALLPGDNNGVLLQLPTIPDTGAHSVAGSMILGIGTRSNNALGSASVYTLDRFANISAVFRGKTLGFSFLDSGSGAYFFSNARGTGMPTCKDADFFYCPNAETDFTASVHGTNGTSGTVSLSVGNADHLYASGNRVFDNLAGPNLSESFGNDDFGDSFDLGLPFFFGRSVFTSIDSQPSPGGDQAYVAF